VHRITYYGQLANYTAQVWKKPRRMAASVEHTAASVVRCSHKRTMKCLWQARRYMSETTGGQTIGDSKTEFNRILCTSKSEAAVTSNKKMCCRYVLANYRQTRSIAQPLCNSWGQGAWGRGLTIVAKAERCTGIGALTTAVDLHLSSLPVKDTRWAIVNGVSVDAVTGLGLGLI